ncbi:MAG: hypothetical protein MRY74_16090, partial [Neomegalonema sp.]|nr:hypothetical protein [Neomegalonema sp.]
MMAAAGLIAMAAPMAATAELKAPGGAPAAEKDHIEATVMIDVLRACLKHATGGATDFRKMDLSAWPGLKPISPSPEDRDDYLDLRANGVYVKIELSEKECGVSTRSRLGKKILAGATKELAAVGEVRGPVRGVSGFFILRTVKDDVRYRATISASGDAFSGVTSAESAWIVLKRD